ncbi:hypothetical protein CROQUDRAFT_96086 [Cronartium quercuum f. sp. fusiforme G11]|uniref:Uncharacterized protein n=1 Tax=Cronartium quercuum f. sp. fusiforme G11 TaxID=708437 RepID=A0A9P6T910_9BASI|nr:hypothetical protein CROQUDRAFT_96086 [Cronartium quercuum f. sp. fusiforme G11]
MAMDMELFLATKQAKSQLAIYNSTDSQNPFSGFSQLNSTPSSLTRSPQPLLDHSPTTPFLSVTSLTNNTLPPLHSFE